jgi:hypothetical protein
MKYIEEIILEDVVKVEFEALTALLCEALLFSFNALCSNFHKESTEAIVAMIQTGIDILNIRQELVLCSVSPPKVHLLKKIQVVSPETSALRMSTAWPS